MRNSKDLLGYVEIPSQLRNNFPAYSNPRRCPNANTQYATVYDELFADENKKQSFELIILIKCNLLNISD